VKARRVPAGRQPKKPRTRVRGAWCPDRSWMEPRSHRHEEPQEGIAHPTVRCPTCNRRLKLQARYCIGGEFVGWRIPPHKAK
jgi:hypothetical protein